MRLRLTVKRNELAPVKFLYALTEEDINVSKLLESINRHVPLEADQWGLEDYMVCVSGYECLHYQDPRSIFQDNDEVE